MSDPHDPPTPRPSNQPSSAGRGADAGGSAPDVALALFDFRVAQLAERESARIGRRNMWLAHHWPEHYAERCVKLGKRHVCRRCAALYPLGFVVAFAAAMGAAPWPASLDPYAIWILSIPATVAYVGEAVGLIGYNIKVQVATTLIAALAFGRALGYELLDRWSSEFWGPIAIFGGIWFLATVFSTSYKAATASSSSSVVL